MNWKLLLIALTLIVGNSARPADETSTEAPKLTTLAATTITEKSTPTEAITKKVEATSTTTETLPTIRYFFATMATKPTNSANKYVNNYANLITKHNFHLYKNSNLTLESGDINSNNSNMFVNVKGVVVGSSLPEAIVLSTATTSNSSSKPIVFIDVDPTITTRRAFVTTGGSWANYNVERPNSHPTRRKKPVIHKIISKWSDNPHEVFNLYGGQSLAAATQASEIYDLTHHLVENSFKPSQTPFSTTYKPSRTTKRPGTTKLYGTTKRPFTTRRPITHFYTTVKKQAPKTTTRKPPTKKPPIKHSTIKTNCKKIKIKLGSTLANQNGFTSKEDCESINIEIDNKLHNVNGGNIPSDDYKIPHNDKFEDVSDSDYDSAEGQKQTTGGEFGGTATGNAEVTATGNAEVAGNGEVDVTGEGDVDLTGPDFINSINQIFKPNMKKKKKAKKNKKKKQTAGQQQIDETDEGGDVGSMVMTMMTMMAIFNPMNFGVWGIILAPMAATLFGGIVVATYSFMKNAPIKYGHGPPAWPHPQEIVIKNRIKHSPLPIKIMHLHKHASSPHKLMYAEPLESYGPPYMMDHYKSPSKNSHGPPTHSEPPRSYGEPPIVNDYHPSAPSGGPYKRKSNYRRLRKPFSVRTTKNSYKFRLL